MCESILFFFFFQAEDGIRDLYVTGVQTCALPISFGTERDGVRCARRAHLCHRRRGRSEERRVGKSVDLGGRRIIKKKKKQSKHTHKKGEKEQIKDDNRQTS